MNDLQVVSTRVGSPRLGWLQPKGCSEMPLREQQDCHGTLRCYGWQLQFRVVPGCGIEASTTVEVWAMTISCVSLFHSATRGSEVLCCTCPWIESSLSQHMAFISKHVGPLCRRARSLLKCFICGCQEHEFSNSHNNERMLYIGHTLLKPKMVKSEKRNFTVDAHAQ